MGRLFLFSLTVMFSGSVAAQGLSLQDTSGLTEAPAKETVIFTAREFRTMDPAQPIVQAVAVRDGRFLAIGSLAEVQRAAPSAGASTTIRKTSRIVTVDGIQFEVFEFGSGPETLIMAAGNGRPAEQLDKLAEAVAARGIKVVTYNYRSLGKSTGTFEGLTLHDWAKDLWRVADALGVKKAHLAGKTYGNRVVRTASADRPDRVLSVILIGAGGEVPPSPETTALYKRYLDPNTPKAEWLELQGKLMYAPGNEHLAAIDAEQGEFPELAAAQAKASEATPNAEWSTGGTAPMLVMTCLLDRVAVPESALIIAKSRPKAWLVGLPNCGHNMLNERGDDLARLMTDFIERTSKEG